MLSAKITKHERMSDAIVRLAAECGISLEVLPYLSLLQFAALVEMHRATGGA